MGKQKKSSKRTSSEDLSAIEKVHGELPDLKPADIVFIRHNKGLLRGMLRRNIGGYWDHVAMVLYPRDLKKQRHKTILVESKKAPIFSFTKARGVAIHQLDKYIHDPEKFDVGVARVKGLTQVQRDRVVTFMLMNVDAPYWPWTNWQLVPGAFSKYFSEMYLRNQRFSCSGIIQKAYYDTMDWNQKKQVVFKSGVLSPLELQELTNPADIASSPLLNWVYNKH